MIKRQNFKKSICSFFSPCYLYPILILLFFFSNTIWAAAPTFVTSPNTTAMVNSEWSYSIDAEDSDGDVLSYSTVGDLPSWLSMENQTVGVVTTLAGDGSGNIFDCPTGIAIDTDGNLFVTTLYDHYIRKVTPDGVVSIFAGSGSRGAQDGIGAEATFNGPIDIEIDKDNNLYISDYYNNSIRKITPDAVVTTYAGTDSGYADGNGTAAMFAHPVSIAVDNDGNLFVCDYYNNLIRKVTPDREVTTVVGNLEGGYVDGVGTDARLARPTSIDIDKDGNLYVADRYNESIRKITPDLTVTTFAGNGYPGYNDGPGETAQFNYPRGVAVDDDGFVYVADLINNLVRRITPEGVVSTFVGSENGYADGTGEDALLNHPAGFGIVGSEIVYLADRENQRIRKIALTESPSLSGTPTEKGGYPVTVRATDGVETTDQTFTINVNGLSQTITFSSLSPVTFGDSEFDISATASSLLPVTFSSSDENVATISDNTVTIMGAGSSIITASQVGNETYSAAQNMEQILVVNKKGLTIVNVEAEDKIYNGDNFATVSAGELSGLIDDNHAVNIVVGTAQFSDKNIGNEKEVTATGYAISGDDSWNYELVEQPSITSANITPRTVTISNVNISDKEYDGTLNASIIDGQLSNDISEDDVTLVCPSASFEDKIVGENKSVFVTGCSLAGADVNNYSLLSTLFTSSATITTKLITVSGLVAENKEYDGTTNATISGIEILNGIILEDDVSLVKGSGAFTDKNVDDNKIVIASDYELSGADAINYTLAEIENLTANINRKPITIAEVTVENKVYNGTTDAIVSGGTLTGLIIDDNVLIVAGTANFEDENVGTSKVVTATGYTLSGLDNTNYFLSSQPELADADITVKPITVSTVAMANKVYDGTINTSVTDYTFSEIVSDDDISVAFEMAYFEDKNVGTNKTATVSEYELLGSKAGNYSLKILPISSTADISSKALNISGLAAINKVYDGTTNASIFGDALLGGLISGDNVTYSIEQVSFIDENVGIGKSIIVTGSALNGTDASNYNIESTENLIANITPKEVNISSALILDKEYDGKTGAQITDIQISGVIPGDDVSITSSIAKFENKNVSINKSVMVSGGALIGVDNGNYAISSNYLITTASITSKPISISGLTCENKVYDGTTAASISGVLTINGVLSGDNVSVTIGAANFEDKNVDTAKVVLITGSSISGTDAINYTLEHQTTLKSAITPLGVSISGIAAQNKEYDRSDMALFSGGIVNGVLPGDTITISGGTVVFEDYSVGKRKNAFASDFNISGVHSKNYYLIEQPEVRSAEILSKKITISNVFAQNKTYDGTTEANIQGGILNGIIAGDDVSFIVGAASFSDESVGLAKNVTVSDFSLIGEDKDSYVLLSQPTVNSANISPEKLLITVDDKMKLVGEADPQFTFTYEGFVNGEDASIVEGLIVEREAGEEAGEYYIIPSGGTAPNYEIIYYDGLLTIDEVVEIIPDVEVTSSEKREGIFPIKNTVSIDEEVFKFVVLSKKPAKVHMKIYDLLGALLDEQDGIAEQEKGRYYKWDMRNDNGVKVAPGSYLIVARLTYDDGVKVIKKRTIGIER